jgi:cobalamin biosynthesis protein CobW
MALNGKIPATVITGFLGAGKTSSVRHLLATANGRRLALIINEFGDLGVDGEILKGCGLEACGEDDVVELANGCLCCTVADDFIPTIEALLERPEPPDHIVIETSGLALPKPLVKAFNWPETARPSPMAFSRGTPQRSRRSVGPTTRSITRRRWKSCSRSSWARPTSS